MANHRYNWQRFWCPRESTIQLDNHGYLLDPETTYGAIRNPTIVPLEARSTDPCLILLGEPGMGKTTTLRDYQGAVQQQLTETDNALLPVDLRACQTKEDLHRDIFHTPMFRTWRHGSHHLHLFLDSLDECALPSAITVTTLINEFQHVPTDRLMLRLACRSTDWPTSVEADLQQLWGHTKVTIMKLAPLRRRDIIVAVQANAIAPGAFLTEVARTRTEPFASKPVTLDLLINLYRKQDQLPTELGDIYTEGCRLLCEESNEYRRDARLTGQCTAAQRLYTAARIAVVSVLTQCRILWTTIDRGNRPANAIPIDVLATEQSQAAVENSESAIKEALATGLFSSGGTHRWEWAHQTYADFLAAYYLKKQSMPSTDLLAFFSAPYDSRIAPQVSTMVSWLASLRRDVFDAVLETDPAILLQSDIAAATDQDRETLVAALLHQFATYQLLDRDFDSYTYRKLAHPHLADQLRPYIQDMSKGWLVRRVAIHIAEACKVYGLQGDLVTVVLDGTQPHTTRVAAALALAQIGDSPTRQRLRPLVLGTGSDDLDDDLKGCGLAALWPEHLSAEELFHVLTPPQHDNFFTWYTHFLSGTFLDHLQPNDLPIALQWVESQSTRLDLRNHNTIALVTDAILLIAWNSLAHPGVVDLFARIVLRRLPHLVPIIDQHNPLRGVQQDSTHPAPAFRTLLQERPHKRRALIDAILPLVRAQDVDLLTRYENRIILPEDFGWLIEQSQAVEGAQLQLVVSKLIEATFDVSEPDHVEIAYNAYQQDMQLPALAQEVIDGISIDSATAEQMRNAYHMRLKLAEPQELSSNQHPGQSLPPDYLDALLNQYSTDAIDMWWQLNMGMLYEADGRCSDKDFDPDINQLPGWHTANDDTRHRIITVAQHYITHQHPVLRRTITAHDPGFLGYRAWRLLLQEDPVLLSPFPTKVWQRWMPVLLYFPRIGEPDDCDRALIQRMYHQIPNELIAFILNVIEDECRERGRLVTIEKVAHCWDDCLADALLTKLHEHTLPANCMGMVLEPLLTHGIDEAKAYAKQIITAPLSGEEEVRARALFAARALIAHAADVGWPVIWPTIRHDAAFGRDLITALACSVDRHAERISAVLTTPQLTDLAIWLVEQYPFTDDPHIPGFHEVTPREHIAWWRNRLLHQLQSRGTDDAVAGFEQLTERFPNEDTLQFYLLDARAQARRESWIGVRLETVLQFLDQPQPSGPSSTDLHNAPPPGYIDQRQGVFIDGGTVSGSIIGVQTNTPVPQPDRPVPLGQKPDAGIDIGIVVALEEEFAILCDILSLAPCKREGKQYYCFQYSGQHQRSYQGVATFVGDMGPTDTSVVVQELVTEWQPQTIIMLGIAGALDRDIKLGDVVVATVVDNYLANAKATSTSTDEGFAFHLSGDPYRCSHELIEQVRHFQFAYALGYNAWRTMCFDSLQDVFTKKNQRQAIRDGLLHKETKLVTGHIASGSIVGTTAAFARFLRGRDRKYAALEMEAAGMLTAVNRMKAAPQTLVIRGISDFADERKQAFDAMNNGGFRRYAMGNTVHLLRCMLDAELF